MAASKVLGEETVSGMGGGAGPGPGAGAGAGSGSGTGVGGNHESPEQGKVERG